MSELKEWTDLTAEETRKIIDFDLPKYYKWFFNFYQKYLPAIIYGLFIIIGILGIIHNIGNWDFWDLMIGFGISIFSIGLWALSAHIVKYVYTKRFSKKMGLSLENWDYLTKGMAIK